jgi:hypothetical protein
MFSSRYKIYLKNLYVMATVMASLVIFYYISDKMVLAMLAAIMLVSAMIAGAAALYWAITKISVNAVEAGFLAEENSRRKAMEGFLRSMGAMNMGGHPEAPSPPDGLPTQDASPEANSDGGSAYVHMFLNPDTVAKVKAIALLNGTDEAEVMGKAVKTYLDLSDKDNADTRVAIINRRTKDIVEEIDI